MKIQILGRGCPKCKKLEKNAENALEQMKENAEEASEGLENVEIEKVYDLQEASKMGLMSAPGLAIDGELKKQGSVLKPDEIREVIQQEA
ncbi:thioredoxin family protein [Candidatus Nanohaloarchaea archaeon]|nr:thioredoxin family protein [Candidatus Nanohaloarchaea archaeon]